MESFNKLASNKTIIIISIIAGVFFIYPNIIQLPWELTRYSTQSLFIGHICFFIFRYLFFSLLIWLLLSINIRKITILNFPQRLLRTFIFTVIAYAIYILTSLLAEKHLDCFTGLLLFQFSLVCLLTALMGHVYAMYLYQRKKEHELEQLKIENLQSRCDALANQINPHFFFNSLNSVTALVRDDRKEQTLEYISKLSGVFRYILRSDKQNLVELHDELDFLEAFRYMLEIRYANKLTFNIKVDKNKLNLLIPVLSLLPLVENIVKHNIIDSENPMDVSIELNKHNILCVSNRINEKLDITENNGIGLTNLSSRFTLLTGNDIKIEIKNGLFNVYLPLNSNSYESADCRG